MSNLIGVAELAARLSDPDTVVLDGSWHLPTANRDAEAEHRERHIPGARFFDIDAISAPDSPLPHTAPDKTLFDRAARALGISNRSRVVVYDSAGIFSAPRVWWLFRLFGHRQTQVLNGGLPAWLEGGHATESGRPAPPPGDFSGKPEPRLIADLAAMRDNARSGAALTLDARPYPRFAGTAPEPRPGLPSGHIPNAVSLPFTELLDRGRYRPAADLQAILAGRGVTAEQPVITSCGSGVTAAVITLALEQCGFGLHRLYDGSWAEWASCADNPIAQGA